MLYLRQSLLALSLILPTVALGADGPVHLYLQPFSPAASRLSFEIASISAIDGHGSEHALKLRLRAVEHAGAVRQRFVAAGRIPFGGYTGLSIRIVRARLRTEHGDVALPVPDTPVKVDGAFVVGREQSPLLWLAFTYEGSVSDGYGFQPLLTLVVPPSPNPGRAGFVTSTGSNTVTVVDKHLAQAVALVDTCAGPAGMALDQHERRLYVACSRDDEVQVIDVTAASVVERARLSPGDAPRELALTPDGSTLLSANPDSNSVTLFHASPLTPVERIRVGNGPASLAIDPAGRVAFVFNTLSSSISVLDIARRTVVATISTDAAPLRGLFDARGARLYVVHERSPFLTVLDPVRLAPVTRVRVKSGVTAIRADVRRNVLYLGGPHDAMVDFYDPTTLLQVDSMNTRVGVRYLTMDAEANNLYLVSSETASVLVGSLAERKVVAEIDVGDDPYWVAVMGEK